MANEREDEREDAAAGSPPGDDARWAAIGEFSSPKVRRGYTSASIGEGGALDVDAFRDRAHRGPSDPSPDTPLPASDPAARWAESDERLVAVIADEIRRDGRITFARFMELALYHPERGYYATSDTRPTRSGDFLTAPETHPVFGQALAGQLEQMWRLLGEPRPFVVREYGAGGGALAVSILERLRATHSGLLDALAYEAVEVEGRSDSALRGRFEESGVLPWLRPPSTTPVVGCVLANELLDALPVHRLVQVGTELCEVYVDWRDGWFAEEIDRPSRPEFAERLRREGVTLTDGQQLEMSLVADDWVRSAAGGLARGYLVAIDYGHPAQELYAPRRSRGTLRAYRGHGVGQEPFRAVGRQDLTAHVDLTAVQRAAEEAGLRLLARTTQAEFLVGAGLGDLLSALGQEPSTGWAEYVAARSASVRLIDPGAMGGFAVLVFGRDVPEDSPLSGLAFRLERPLRARR